MKPSATIPLSATALVPSDVNYSEDSNWSSQTVYPSVNVTVNNGATVNFDQEQTVKGVSINNGTLDMSSGQTLVVTESLQIESGGEINLASGTLTSFDDTTVIKGALNIDGGTFYRNMDGVSTKISGSGLIHVASGSMSYGGGAPTNILILNTNMLITGGIVDLSGQIYLGDGVQRTMEIVGTAPSVSISRFNGGPGGESGTFKFVLSEAGVSKVNVSGWMNLDSTSLVVDGSSYTGGAGTLVLVDSANLVGFIPEAKITITGFAEKGLMATVVQDETNGKDWVQLVITETP